MTAPATLDRAGIAQRIPHAGTMCLLDELLSWDARQIHCLARNQADADHPLRSASGLLSAMAIEYASQAMALHGSLTAVAGAAPQPGFLASARQVTLHVPRLDDAPGPLSVRAEHVAGDGLQALYQFTLHDGEGRLLVQGRAAVVLNTPLPGVVLNPPLPATMR